MIFNKKLIGTIFIVLGIGFFLWASGLIGIGMNGISYYSENAGLYINNGAPVEGKYSVTIDLSDLESNDRKVIYEEGKIEFTCQRYFIMRKQVMK